MPIILFILGLGCFVAAMSMGGSAAAFIDMPSLMIVVGPTILVGASFHSPAGLISAFRDSLGAATIERASAQASLAALRTLRSLALACGGLGTFIGLVSMLRDLGDPAKLGPAMAVALLAPMYGVMISETVLRPLAHRIEARMGA